MDENKMKKVGHWTIKGASRPMCVYYTDCENYFSNMGNGFRYEGKHLRNVRGETLDGKSLDTLPIL